MGTEKGLLEQISNSNNFILTILKKSFALVTNPTTYFHIKSKSAKVYLLLSPQYNNLGDHAIAMASIQVLKEQFADYEIVEITSNYYKNFKKSFSKSVTPNDILVIIGGGFMGDLWLTLENMVRDIIISFSENKIIILPQTVYFDTDEEKQRSKEIYLNHTDLHLMVRDHKSFELCTQDLKIKNVYYLPDIVSILEVQKYENKTPYMGLCLRKDKEQMQHRISEAKIEETILNMGYKIIPCTTLVKIPFVFPFQRKKMVLNKIKEIASYKFIVTNRLHCMLFAYLSQTPCIAFDNKSKKVSGVYEWIKDCGFVQLYDDNIPLENQINVVLNSTVMNDQLSEKLKNCFNEVFKQIK